MVVFHKVNKDHTDFLVNSIHEHQHFEDLLYIFPYTLLNTVNLNTRFLLSVKALIADIIPDDKTIEGFEKPIMSLKSVKGRIKQLNADIKTLENWFVKYFYFNKGEKREVFPLEVLMELTALPRTSVAEIVANNPKYFETGEIPNRTLKDMLQEIFNSPAHRIALKVLTPILSEFKIDKCLSVRDAYKSAGMYPEKSEICENLLGLELPNQIPTYDPPLQRFSKVTLNLEDFIDNFSEDLDKVARDFSKIWESRASSIKEFLYHKFDHFFSEDILDLAIGVALDSIIKANKNRTKTLEDKARESIDRSLLLKDIFSKISKGYNSTGELDLKKLKDEKNGISNLFENNRNSVKSTTPPSMNLDLDQTEAKTGLLISRHPDKSGKISSQFVCFFIISNLVKDSDKVLELLMEKKIDSGKLECPILKYYGSEIAKSCAKDYGEFEDDKNLCQITPHNKISLRQLGNNKCFFTSILLTLLHPIETAKQEYQ